ncbi:ArnT family glycosyltransferase [Paralimibaculum aggregatum]|uniref:ArnT family glycosyltransferase n=1 Tax=Paralimibaculum aggregatum TaxID=3036245 RepID=UPI00255635ED|nr:glycosyltransferase family 39 protein [Limibaculum sp. NKW23]
MADRPPSPARRLCGRLETWLAAALDRAAASPLRRSLLIAAVALAAILPGLAAMPVTDRDEARFVQASKQMVESGDLIDIRFQDAPRWKKPVGIYWMQAGSAALAGGSAAPVWAYRLPSALAALAAAILLGWAARPLVGARAAALSGVLLASCLLALGEANIAKTDAVLMACSVAAFAGLARMLAAPEARLPWGVVLLFWGAVGLAGLVKGPIVPLIVLLTLAGLWLWARRPPPLLRLRPGVGVLLAAAIVLPWLVAIWQVSEGRFFAESVGKDLLGKVAEGQEKHWGPPGLFLALVWLTLWPWSALLPAAVPWAWAKRRLPFMALLAAWVVPFWIVLEAVPTKLPHYVLPLYPALLVGLAAWALAEDRPVPGPRTRWAGALIAAVPGCLLALALVGLPLALEGRLPWPALLLAPLGAGASLLAARAALDDRPLAQIAASLVAVLTLAGGVLQFGLPALETAFPSPRIAAAAAPWRACASGPLVTAGYREPSLVFLTETGTRLATPEEAARALASDPGTLMLLEDRWKPLLERHWESPPALVERARLSYFNYNRGDMETAAIVTPEDPRWTACAAAAGG